MSEILPAGEGMQQTPDFNSELGEIIVTLVKEFSRIDFVDADGGSVYPSQVMPAGRAEFLHARVTKLYFAMGSGIHTIQELGECIDVTAAKREVMLVGKIFPDEILTVDAPDNDSLALQFGNIALAVRKPNDAECAAIDEGKLDLALHDHAVITASDQRYLLPLEVPDELIAARVIDVLSRQGRSNLTLEEIAADAWRRMTLAERRQVVAEPSRIFREAHQSDFQKRVHSVLGNLVSKLRVVREPYSGQFNVDGSNLSIAFSDVQHRYEDPSMRLISSTGPRQVIEVRTLSEGQLQTAQHILESALSGRHFTHEVALDVLDFIVLPEGKSAVAEIAAQRMTGQQLSPIEALKIIHGQLKRSLGNTAYEAAHQDRTIHGNTVTRSNRIQQVGGRLSGKTKWHIGRPAGEIYDDKKR